jgi:hypothetical protein
MRTLVLLGWLMVPVLFGAHHNGPGPEKSRVDDASRVLADADRLAGAGQWEPALARYDEALKSLPEGGIAEARRVRLQRAKVQRLAHQLPEANSLARSPVVRRNRKRRKTPARPGWDRRRITRDPDRFPVASGM